MQFPILIAVLVALATAEAEGEVAHLPTWGMFLAWSAALAGPALAWLGCLRLACAGRRVAAEVISEKQWIILIRRCDRLQRWVLWLWLAGIVSLLVLGRWAAVVRRLEAMRSWPLADELAVLAPVTGSLLLIWAAFYWLEERLCGSWPGPRKGGGLRGLLSRLWFEFRQGLGLLVVPPLAVALVRDLARWVGLEQGVIDKGWLLVALPLGAVLAMPLVLRQVWKTTPLPEGPLRQEVLAVFGRAKCPITQVLLWHTGGRQANAVVVGLLPWLRYVLISDRLLTALTSGELMAVLRHEVAHVKKGHLGLRLAVLALPVVGWWAWSVASTQEGGLPLAHHAAAATFSLGQPLWASMAFPAVMLAYAWVVLGRYSRLLEHEADLEACLTDEGRVDPWVAEDLADALRVVVGRQEGEGMGAWLHPPVVERLAFLRRATADSRFVRRFRWRLRSMALGVVVLYLAAGGLILLGR